MGKTFSTVFIVILLATFAYAQDSFVLDVVTESVKTVTHSTDLIIDDPAATSTIYNTNTLLSLLRREQKRRSEGRGEKVGESRTWGVHFCPEMEISPSTKSIKAPLSFTYMNYAVGINVPIIFKRTMKYTRYEAEASGIGDMLVSLGYAQVSEEGLNWGTTFFVKLPTGDAEALDNNYLVPLGTGSTDYIISGNALYPLSGGEVTLDALYRINGSDLKITEAIDTSDPTHIITTDYDITNGNIFSCKVMYYRRLLQSLDGYLMGNFLKSADGNTEWSREDNQLGMTSGGYPNRQEMTLLDLTPGLNYSFRMLTARLNVTIPLMTSRDELNREEDRGMTMRFGVTFDY